MNAKPYNREFGNPLPPIPEKKLPKKKLNPEIKNDTGLEKFLGHKPEDYANRLEHLHSIEAKKVFETVCAISEDIKKKGGRALLVGGAVRDEIVGMQSKDFDIEIYGLQPNEVEETIHKYGKVDSVGKAFGILKIMDDSGFDIDVSLPRTDSKIGEGYRGFEVKVDPFMSIKEAAKRRDFTFNALSKDPLTGEIFDGYGGVEDLQKRILKVTDPERFVDDPLRILRAAQFVGRFGLKIEPQSMELMRGMLDELGTISKERFKSEWEKLLTKSIKPSMGLTAMNNIGVIDKLYPELSGLKNTEQEFDWHPEGDVWIHTLMVTDAAAELVQKLNLEKEESVVVMWGALCHDMGKPATTTYERGRIRSKGHEAAGEEPTKEFLSNVGLNKKDIQKVIAVVREHLWPSVMYMNNERGQKVTDGAFRRLAKRLEPATIAELTYVAQADHMGRGPFLDADHIDQFLLPDPYAAGEWVRKRADELNIYKEIPQPMVRGKELIQLGMKPSRDFGEIIQLCDDLRDDQAWTHKQALELIAGHKNTQAVLKALKNLQKAK